LFFQYNQCFAQAFATEAEMAQFLGRYTQWALLAALVMQLLVVNRLVTWLGLKGAHLLYAGLLAATSVMALWPMTLTGGVLARFVEQELRFGLRNPVSQMIV